MITFWFSSAMSKVNEFVFWNNNAAMVIVIWEILIDEEINNNINRKSGRLNNVNDNDNVMIMKNKFVFFFLKHDRNKIQWQVAKCTEKRKKIWQNRIEKKEHFHTNVKNSIIF